MERPLLGRASRQRVVVRGTLLPHLATRPRLRQRARGDVRRRSRRITSRRAANIFFRLYALYESPFLILVALVAVVYGIASVTWYAWLKHSYTPAAGGGAMDLFARPDLPVLWLHGLNLALLFTWQAPLFGVPDVTDSELLQLGMTRWTSHPCEVRWRGRPFGSQRIGRARWALDR